MSTADPVDLLGSVPLFEELSRKERAAIARAAKRVTHRPGSVLAREGQTGAGFFLILDGIAKVDVGRRKVSLGPGDFFGEISLLDGGPRTATVTAVTDVTTLGLTPWDFMRLVDQHPSIARKLLKVMAQRLRASSRDLAKT